MYRGFVKRQLDFILALGGFIIISPFILMLLVLVYLRLGSPVLFQQQRPGLHGRPFTLYKFRTMVDKYNADGDLLPDAERLTPFGRFLRRTSLDELPELINVLRGEMSLVGPRPLLMRYLPYYSSREQLRHTIRPGITGWAQLNGRNNLSWDERFSLDVWYVENYSFRLDIYVLFRTITKVIKREDVIVDTHSNMQDLDEERVGRS